jgi:DNA polymerase-3 subunit epsilon
LNLNLKRPIAFIDLETTGINVSTDRIVELSVLKISPSGKEQWLTTRVNPEMAIPAKSTAIHGIKDEDVSKSPTFKEVARNLSAFLEGCDLAGYNAIKFDIPVLAEEFLRVNIDFSFRKKRYVDVQVIFHKKEQRTLSAAYQFYCKKELEDAHSSKAENDVEKLADFSSFGSNVDFAGRIVLDEKGVEIFNFGKHKGKPVEVVFNEEPAYYSWMMNGEFPLYTKKVLTEIKLRSFGKTQG